MATGIHSLSPELTDAIIEPLSNDDLFNLRLGSRSLKAISLPSFGRRFFRKRTYTLTKRSLAALVKISRHPELAPALRTLIVSRRSITRRFSANLLPDEYCAGLSSQVGSDRDRLDRGAEKRQGLRDSGAR